MILTKEFLVDVNSCTEGYRYGLENNLIGGDYDSAINFCNTNGQPEFGQWLQEQKSTEAYVRANGSVIIMGAYQVFNPITGQHTRYETETEARNALIEVQKVILNNYGATIVQELLNEKGDATWIPTDIHKTLEIR